MLMSQVELFLRSRHINEVGADRLDVFFSEEKDHVVFVLLDFLREYIAKEIDNWSSDHFPVIVE